MGNTNETPLENNENAGTEISIPKNFFLILKGAKAIPLNKRLTSIGRSLGNSVVIDDPRISRRHLEIRLISDHFVVFDMHSKGGTYVNGQRVSQGVLYPGDLITLAGVDLVFIQDHHMPERGKIYTNPIRSADYPTADFHSSVTEKDIKGKGIK